MSSKLTHTTSATLSTRHYALIGPQLIFAYLMSIPQELHPAGIPVFGTASMAYGAMVLLLASRNRKQGLTLTDRRVITFAFLPVYFLADLVLSLFSLNT